tara:strand:+ start:200 stop:1150 length:951 start_codon:yes stop_codon:yes gene_type:complete
MARKNGKTTKQRQANKASKKTASKPAKKPASLPKIDKVKTSVRRAKSTSASRTPEKQKVLDTRAAKNKVQQKRNQNQASNQADKKYLKDLGKFELKVDGKEYGYRDPGNLSAFELGSRGDHFTLSAMQEDQKYNPNAYEYTDELYQYSPGAIKEAAFRAGINNANSKDDVAKILKEMRSPSARKVEFEAVNRSNNRQDKKGGGGASTAPSEYATEADSMLSTIDSKLDGIMNKEPKEVDPLTFQYAASSVVNSGNNLTIGSATDPSKSTGTDKFKRRGKKKKNRLLKQIGSSGLGGFAGPAASAAGAATSSAFGGV